MTRVLLFLALVFSALAARADDPQADARLRFDAGRSLFRAGRFDAAADEFIAAFDRYPDPAYLYNTGLCYERAGRWRLAVQYWDAFLKAQPESAARTEVEGRRRAAVVARAAELGRVTIVAPDATKVTVDHVAGQSSCAAPCALEVDPGPVSVSASRGVVTFRESRVMAPRGTWRVVVAFGPTGELIVTDVPPGAGVRVDDQPIEGERPISLPVGEHTVTVVEPGGATRRIPVTVRSGGPTSVSLGVQSAVMPPIRVAGWVTLGLGVASLVTGVTLAVLSQREFDDGEALLDGPRSPSAEAELADHRGNVRTYSLAADLSFGLAGVGVATALGLLLAPLDEEGEP